MVRIETPDSKNKNNTTCSRKTITDTMIKKDKPVENKISTNSMEQLRQRKEQQYSNSRKKQKTTRNKSTGIYTKNKIQYIILAIEK